MSRFVSGTCRLCLTEQKICYSRIIPEFFFVPAYDQHRVLYLPANPSKPIRWQQKGLREYMLCPLCENQLSKYENYAKYLLHGGPYPLVAVENTGDHAICEQASGHPTSQFFLRLDGHLTFIKGDIEHLDFLRGDRRLMAARSRDAERLTRKRRRAR